jgi:thymidine phosphorylase
MSTSVEIPVLIGRKRDGGTLTSDEIAALIDAYVHDGSTTHRWPRC